MIAPNFMCIGAPKSGTTTLYEILKQHPDVYLSSSKEPHFFDIDENFNTGYKNYLKEYYKDAAGHVAIGDFTPSYLMFPKVSNRILKCIGADTKFILILRNPVDRAYSQYLHSKRDLIETLSFEDSILKEAEDLRLLSINCDDVSYIRRSYLEGGMYFKHLSVFLKDFHPSQFKIFIFENEFINNRLNMLEEICEFLEIKDYKFDINIKSNSASVTRFTFLKKMLKKESKLKTVLKYALRSSRLRGNIRNFLHKISNKNSPIQKLSHDMRLQILHKYFMNDIKQLENLINKDLSIWYENKNEYNQENEV